jgi:hypothetical protein
LACQPALFSDISCLILDIVFSGISGGLYQLAYVS